MPARKQDAYKALELMEQYLSDLQNKPGTNDLQDALGKAIVAIRSKLFQALLDIHEFYEYTLDNAAKSVEVKEAETRELTDKWEKHTPPVPVDVKRIAQQTVPQTDQLNGSFEDSRRSTSPYKISTPPALEEPIETKETENTREEVVVIMRHESRGLGLSIAGGNDNPHAVGEYGIFVTKLTPDSPAEKCGLIQLGDQILSVNGVSLVDIAHVDAVNTLKGAGTRVELCIKRYLDRVWSPAMTEDTLDRPESRERDLESPPITTPSPELPKETQVVEVTLHKKERGLGFSIAGGYNNRHFEGDDGIFITKIIEGGLADEDGTLSVNDRILSVNGKTMVGISHEDAVGTLKGTGKNVKIKVEKGSAPITEDADLIDKPRIVTLDRPDGIGLGFNIIGGEEEVGIFISVLSPQGLAAESGLLKRGDMILEVNEQNLERWSHDSAAVALKNAGDVVTLKVVYKPKEFEELYRRMQLQPEIRQLYVRALFAHDVTKDNDRPGEGLAFNQGAILHIVNGSDEEWWQAAVVDNDAIDGPVALIPSKRRLERRARSGSKTVKFGEAKSSGTKARRSFKLPFGKKNSSAAAATTSEDSDIPQVEDEPIQTYEPVNLTKRPYARPVIVLGPMKEDINDKLVKDFPEKFAGCVPHTTRKARPGEVDGRDYHFVASVEQMERDIQAHMFIEAGRYKDNLYGTSIQAVKEVAEQFKHCILGVSGYAIRRLNMAELSPIAVCILPSSPEVIKAADPRFSEEQVEQMYKKGESIQTEFADLFTAEVDGNSMDEIYDKVKTVIRDNSGEFIWVPSNEQL